jgi:uncharacterized protein (TIGR02597 family)
MKPTSIFSIALAATLSATLTTTALGQATTVPVGAMTVSIPAGTTSVPSNTVVAVPLQDPAAPSSGVACGKITSYSGSVITVTDAGWTDSALASTTAPYMLQFTSGSAQGRYYEISANTATTVTVVGADLATEGVANDDSFQIVPVDTLKTLFGSSTLLGGTTAAASDAVYIFEGGSWVGYYYNTTYTHWRKLGGPQSDKDNVVLKPDTGFIVQRKSDALTLTFTGRVPSCNYKTSVANAGNTVIMTGFPKDTTIGDLALDTKLSGWVKNSSAASADKLTIFEGGSWVSYYHNTSMWRKTGGPATDKSGVVISAGVPIIITKVGSASGETAISIPLPYSL